MAGARRFTPRHGRRTPGPVSPPGRPVSPIRYRPIGQRQTPPLGHDPPQGRADHGRSRASTWLRTTIPALQSLQSGDYRPAVKSLAGNPAKAALNGPFPVGNTPRIVFCNPSFSPIRGRTVGNLRRGLQSDPSGPAEGVRPGQGWAPIRPPADGVGRRLVQPLPGHFIASHITGTGPVTATAFGRCAGTRHSHAPLDPGSPWPAALSHRAVPGEHRGGGRYPRAHGVPDDHGDDAHPGVR